MIFFFRISILWVLFLVSAIGNGAPVRKLSALPLDQLKSGLVAVHSVDRRLLSSYEGPLFRMRRGVTNEEIDVFPDSTGRANIRMMQWLANGQSCFLVQVYDQSGKGRHIIQNTATQQPFILNTEGLVIAGADAGVCAYFDGTDDLIIGSPTEVATATATIVARYYKNADAFMSITNYSPNTGTLALLETNSSNGFQALSNNIGYSENSNTPLSAGVWSTSALSATGGGLTQLYRNGVRDDADESTTLSWSSVGIGWGTGGGFNWMNGLISSTAVWDRVLTAAEHRQAYQALDNVAPSFLAGIPDPALWFDASRQIEANGAGVAKILDISGNRHTAKDNGSAAVLTHSSQNGLPTLTLNGDSYNLTTFPYGGITLSGDFSIFIMARCFSDSLIFSKAGDNRQIRMDYSGNNSLFYYDGVDAVESELMNTPSGQYRVMEFRRTGSNLECFENGSTLGKRSLSGSTSFTLDAFAYYADAGSTHFSGDIGEVVVIPATLRPDQGLRVTDYLCKKWGITRPFTPDQIPGMRFWLDPAGENLYDTQAPYVLTDRSTHRKDGITTSVGNSLLQPTYTTSGINGLPSVEFTSDQQSKVVTPGIVSPAVSAFMVWNPDFAESNMRMLDMYVLGGGDHTDPGAGIPFYQNAGNYNLFWGGSNRLALPLTVGATAVLSANLNASDVGLGLNGTWTTTSLSTGPFNAQRMAIGGWEGESGSPRGKMGDVIVYDRTLTSTQRVAVENLLMWKYGVGPIDPYAADLAGAWSVNERLLGSYTGPLFRMRRAFDNSEFDIPFGPDNKADRGYMLSLCRGGNGYITKVYSQNGAGDFVQTTSTKQPRIVNTGVIETLDGEVCMTLENNGDKMLPAETDTYTGNSITAFAKFAPRDDEPIRYYARCIGIGKYDSGTGGSLSDYNSSTRMAIGLRRDGAQELCCYRAPTGTVAMSIPITSWGQSFLLSYVNDGATGGIFTDGTTTATDTEVAAFDTDRVLWMDSGTPTDEDSAAGSKFVDCIVWHAAKSPTEMTNIRKALAR